MGTAFVRYALESHIDPSRAVTAAVGLGTDSLQQFRSEPETYGNYAWTTRWDNATEADEFEDAVSEYFDARGNETASGWRLGELALTVELRRPTADTVVMLVGSESFVTETTASGTAGEIVLASEQG